MSTIIKTLVVALAASAAASPAWTWEKARQVSSSSSIRSTSTSTSSTTTTAAATATPDAQKVLAESLRTKVTQVDRMKAIFLNADGTPKTGAALRNQTTFDFNTAVPAAGELGGRKAAATVDRFPLLTGSGLSTTVAFLGACGMNTPHVHPRANEFLTVVSGTVSTGMILENGVANEITSTLNAFQATLFPIGSIHYQFNPNCDPTTFVSTLSSEDPGTNQVAQGFFGLNGDVVAAATGFQNPTSGKDIESFRAKIPVSLAKGIESCLAKCNIPKR